MSTNCNTFYSEVVPGGRIELPTRGFSGLCSTTELPRPIQGGRQNTDDWFSDFVCNKYSHYTLDRERAGSKREISSFAATRNTQTDQRIQICEQKSRENAYKVSSKKNT
jgi:hypothetical protein